LLQEQHHTDTAALDAQDSSPRQEILGSSYIRQPAHTPLDGAHHRSVPVQPPLVTLSPAVPDACQQCCVRTALTRSPHRSTKPGPRFHECTVSFTASRNIVKCTGGARGLCHHLPCSSSFVTMISIISCVAAAAGGGVAPPATRAAPARCRSPRRSRRQSRRPAPPSRQSCACWAPARVPAPGWP